MPRPLLSALVLLAFSWLIAPASAQSHKLQWGAIPHEDLALSAYAPDTGAVAVVLGDEGEVRFRRNLSITFERHRRVKVFRPAGYDAAEVEIVYRPATEDLKGVGGHTFVLDAAGRERKVKLDRGSILEEDLEGGLRLVRFTLPALEPGAVFEYRYTLELESPFAFPDWTFQGTIPTRWSSFHAEIPRYLDYARFVQGNPTFAVEEIDEQPLDLLEWERNVAPTANTLINDRLRPGGPSEIQGKRYERHVNTYHWAVEDVPALTEEPYLTTLDDHFQRIEFQFATYFDEYKAPHAALRSWDELADELRGRDDFGRHLRPSGDVRRQVEALGLDSLAASARVGALYDFVRHGILWDETYRAFADDDLGRVLEQRRGSSAEVNLLLISLLRAAEVNAFPVLLSTRSHGRVLQAYPQLSQLNHVLALVVVGEAVFLLDATDPNRPAGMLPVEALSGSGWLVTDDHQEWISVASTTQTGTTVFVDGTLEADGTVGGTFSARLVGYHALSARQVLEGGAGGIGEAVDAPATVDLSGIELDGVEDDGAITVRSTFQEPGRGQAVARLLTFNPILLGGFEANPLWRPERTYPVDFAYPYTATYNADIALPEGYVVGELPEPVTASLPENAVQYRRTMEVKDGKLRVRRHLAVQRVHFEPEEYDALRAFFDEVVAGDAATVVLERSGAGD